MVRVNGQQRRLLQECWDLWGEESQVDMTIEELSELITALIQFKRGRISIREVATEIADSLIMLNEFNIVLEEIVDEEYDFKIKRLNERMKEWKLEQFTNKEKV